jgi:hypothetical protein
MSSAEHGAELKELDWKVGVDVDEFSVQRAVERVVTGCASLC